MDTRTEERDTNAGAEDTEAGTGGGSVEAALASVDAVEAVRVARAEDTVAGETEAVTERSYACKQCGKTFATAKKRDDHKRNHIKKLCSLCGKEFKADNFKRHQERCRKKHHSDGRSEVTPGQVEIAAAAPVVASPSIPSSLHTEVVREETGDQDRVEMETDEVAGAAELGIPGLSSLAMEQESEEMGAQQDSSGSLPRMMEEVQEEVAVPVEAPSSSPAMVEETQHQVEDTDPGPAQQNPDQQKMTSLKK